MSGLSAPAGAAAAVPSCAEVEGDCAKSGWVWKQSKHVKKWNKRYFVLWPKQPHPKKGRLLFYYTTPQVRTENERAERASQLLRELLPGMIPRERATEPLTPLSDTLFFFFSARRTRSREGSSRWCLRTTALRSSASRPSIRKA